MPVSRVGSIHISPIHWPYSCERGELQHLPGVSGQHAIVLTGTLQAVVSELLLWESSPAAMRNERKAALEQRHVCALWKRFGTTAVRRLVTVQDALIGEHVEVQQLLLSGKGKVFRKGIGLVEHTVPEAEDG